MFLIFKLFKIFLIMFLKYYVPHVIIHVTDVLCRSQMPALTSMKNELVECYYKNGLFACCGDRKV